MTDPITKTFLIEIIKQNELISASKLSKRGVNCNTEFLKQVKIKGEKDKKYQQG
jgi:hypothetical protein